MKTALTFLLFAFSLSAFAVNDVVKETWTCKSNKTEFNVVLTQDGQKNELSISYLFNKVSLELEAGQSFLQNGAETVLVGEFYQGYDSYNYTATLKRLSDTKGKLVLVSDMYLDCLGQSVESETVNCQVVTERK